MNEDNGGRSESFSHSHQAAKLLKTHRGQILGLWIDTTCQKVQGAQGKGRAELADHLTELLDDIVYALDHPGLHHFPEDMSELGFSGHASALHGRERSAMEGYSVRQVAHEYIILRHVVTSFCMQHNLDDEQTLEAVNHVIEFASLTAVTAFAQAVQEIQQKLVGTLVHDVRTPLGVASTYAELIRLGGTSADRQNIAVETIVRNLKRAQAMLEDLLDITKLGAGQGLFMRFDKADLNGALKTICTEANQVYMQRIVCSLEDHQVVGIFDIGLVTRTVENLISNAVKFGNEGSPITISLRDKGDYVDVRVHNDGEPIPQKDVDRIFNFFSEPVSRSHNHTKGWGLGLSLIKTVAKSHGGDVIVESAMGQGTTFGMTLFKTYKKEGDQLSILL